MPKRLSPEQIETIKSMSEHHHSQLEIAEAAGCCKGTVGKYQAELDIPASNRYGGGALASTMRDEAVSFRKAEQRNGGERERQPREWCAIAEKSYTLMGIDTGYMYNVATNSDEVIITTNNKNDVHIELKNLVAFGNELLDVAETIQKIKENRFGI